jgi:transposase
MFRAVIPQGRREKRRRPFDGGLYDECNRVERLVGRLKLFRRVATRYEKTARATRRCSPSRRYSCGSDLANRL